MPYSLISDGYAANAVHNPSGLHPKSKPVVCTPTAKRSVPALAGGEFGARVHEGNEGAVKEPDGAFEKTLERMVEEGPEWLLLDTNEEIVPVVTGVVGSVVLGPPDVIYESMGGSLAKCK